jgi:hypothetical protein
VHVLGLPFLIQRSLKFDLLDLVSQKNVKKTKEKRIFFGKNVYAIRPYLILSLKTLYFKT